MAGTFILGETKVRPGTYFNIQKKGGNERGNRRWRKDDHRLQSR